MDNRDLWIQAAKDCQAEIHGIIERRFNELRSVTKTWEELKPQARKTAEAFLAANPGQWIHAIKHVRDVYGCGLKEAKDLVDEVRGFPPTPKYTGLGHP